MTETKKKWELAYEAKLLQLFTELMDEVGGVRRPGSLNVWDMNTTVGLLRLTCYDDWVPGRFEDHVAARRLTDCNPHSGKWNHHAFWTQAKSRKEAVTPEDFVAQIRRGLAKVWHSAVPRLEAPVPPTELETDLKNMVLTLNTKNLGHLTHDLYDVLKRLVKAVQEQDGVARRVELAKSVLIDAQELLKY